MAQQRYKINNTDIWQPDKDLTWSYETTYTSDSTRTQDGVGHFTEMFTTESFSYKATHVPIAEWTKISQMIVGKKYNLYAFNPHFGKWMTMRCYTGKGSLQIGDLEEGCETYSSISFDMVDIIPLENQS